MRENERKKAEKKKELSLLCKFMFAALPRREESKVQTRCKSFADLLLYFSHACKRRLICTCLNSIIVIKFFLLLFIDPRGVLRLKEIKGIFFFCFLLRANYQLYIIIREILAKSGKFQVYSSEESIRSILHEKNNGNGKIPDDDFSFVNM